MQPGFMYSKTFKRFRQPKAPREVFGINCVRRKITENSFRHSLGRRKDGPSLGPPIDIKWWSWKSVCLADVEQGDQERPSWMIGFGWQPLGQSRITALREYKSQWEVACRESSPRKLSFAFQSYCKLKLLQYSFKDALNHRTPPPSSLGSSPPLKFTLHLTGWEEGG